MEKIGWGVGKTAGLGAAGGEYGQYFQQVVVILATSAAPSLRRRILLLFVGIYFLALALLVSGNLTVHQSSVAELTGFWALEMLGLAFVFILPGYLLSCRLLRPLELWLVHGTTDPHVITAARRAAFRYPWQALLFFAAFGIVGSGLFHLSETWHELSGWARMPGWWQISVRNYIYEFSLSLALGVAFFAGARRLLRPYLLTLPPPAGRDVQRFSIRSRFLVTILALTLVNALPLFTAYLEGYYFHKLIGGVGLTVILVQGLLLSGAIGWVAANDTATDLAFVTRELSALARGQRVGRRRPLPLASDDETGDLVLAFNALQAQAAAADQELEQELELARRVQAELLPRPVPATNGWRVTARSRAAREVGGDFYDIIPLGEGRLGVAVGDAAGKGLPAALLMAATLGFLRAEVNQEPAPGKVLSRMNRLLCGTIPPGFFVTLLYMVIDTGSGECVFSSAGHIDPLVAGPQGEAAEFLPVASLPLGLDPAVRYREQRLAVGPGHKLVLYTDGLVEARSEARKLFGFTRLAEMVTGLAANHQGETLADGLYRAVQEFTACRELEDDQTLVIIEAPEGEVTWRRILREPSTL